MPRNWHLPDQPPGTPPAGGRKAKAGARIPIRLAPEVRAALDAEGERLRAAGQKVEGLGEVIGIVVRRAGLLD